MSANLENSAVATGLEKVVLRIPKKGNVKECSNYRTMTLISHASQSNAQNSPSMNFQMLKLDLKKAEEPEIKLPTSVGS